MSRPPRKKPKYADTAEECEYSSDSDDHQNYGAALPPQTNLKNLVRSKIKLSKDEYVRISSPDVPCSSRNQNVGIAGASGEREYRDNEMRHHEVAPPSFSSFDCGVRYGQYRDERSMRVELQRTVRKGIFYSEEAARLVMHYRKSGCYSPSDYALFLKTDEVRSVVSLEEGLFNEANMSVAYSNLLTKLRVDVMFAAMQKANMSITAVKTQVSSSQPSALDIDFSTGSVPLNLIIPPGGDFREVNLNHLTISWREPARATGFKKIVNALCGKASKFKAIKLRKDELCQLELMLMGIRNYTYANAYILSIPNLSSCSGSEREQMYNVSIPYVCAVMKKDPISMCIILCEWVILRLVCDVRGEQYEDHLEAAKDLGAHLNAIVARCHPELMTMKYHQFMNHFIHNESSQFGPPKEYSTCTSERWHKEIQIHQNQFSTHCKQRIIEGYLIKKNVSKPQKKNHTCVDFRINNDLYFPTNGRITGLIDCHRYLASPDAIL